MGGWFGLAAWLFALAGWPATPSFAQALGAPDRAEPGDEMIQAYLRTQAEPMDGTFLPAGMTAQAWRTLRPQYQEEFLYMLGLWPLPARTPLYPVITGQLDRREYVVEKLHYQSRPRLYVTADLYRPALIGKGERLPAVLYVCGHSPQGRDGNKVAYQAHGIWLARHGYICLMVDTLQLGEIAGIHHGTYRENRWWWHSRGYTSAGVECWNGVRGIDYLISRGDVDPERLAVTGISGGGAATYWIAAADDRVTVAAPVSGMADLISYVPQRVINGHCDCMFLYNTFAWPWTRIAGLIAPRPLLFVNSDQDDIFPMDANERVINRLKRLYSLFGASDQVDSVVSVGGHAYRQDLRQAVFRFLNTRLKNDPRPVLDSEVDLVTTADGVKYFPIPPEALRVFPTDADLPQDQLNSRIDEYFVPLAKVSVPASGGFEPWQKGLRDELRRVTFRCFPERIPPGRVAGQSDNGAGRLETEPGIQVRLEPGAGAGPTPTRVLLVVSGGDTPGDDGDWVKAKTEAGDAVYRLEPRGVGSTRWTRKNPPNYVERSHVLLGRTVDTGRVWDIVAAARYLSQKYEGKVPVTVAGSGANAVLGAYAALWEPEIARLVLRDPPPTHMAPSAPQFLNVLRVCDVPEALGLLAPRPLAIEGGPAVLLKKVKEIYAAAGASDRLVAP